MTIKHDTSEPLLPLHMCMMTCAEYVIGSAATFICSDAAALLVMMTLDDAMSLHMHLTGLVGSRYRHQHRLVSSVHVPQLRAWYLLHAGIRIEDLQFLVHDVVSRAVPV